MDIRKQFEMYTKDDADYSRSKTPEQEYTWEFEKEQPKRKEETREEPLTSNNKTLEDTVQGVKPEDVDGPITIKEKLEQYIPRGLVTEVGQNLPYMIIAGFAIYNISNNLKK